MAARTQKLKVYGWTGWRGSGQTREVVAATSKAEAARLVNPDKPWMRPPLSEVCETGNDDECTQAMSAPGTVFWHPLDELPRDRDWRTA